MKKSNRFPVLSLVFVMLVAVSLACGCNTPTGEPPYDTEAVTTSATKTTTSYSSTFTVTTATQADFSCLLEYWEVEPDSLRHMANSIITVQGLYITFVGPSVLFAFYSVSSEPSPQPYRIDVWYTNVEVIANLQRAGEENPQQINMYIDGVYTADISSDRPGEIFYRPIEGETQI